MNFVCVYYGSKYTYDYVIKLYNMVQRNLTIPHKFICFTDSTILHKYTQNTKIELRKFKLNDMQGWFNKLQLFSPDSQLEGNNLYMDLDVVILKNIDCFATYGEDHNFVGMNDFNPKSGQFNSSIMKFNNKTTSQIIWKPYISDREGYRSFTGDQNIITELIKKHKDTIIFPDSWTQSYKWYDRKGERYGKEKWTFEMHPEAKVCVFHGKPNPHESTKEWVKTLWI